ncbi:MAG TPA: hypothetical protein VG820_03275, partial [Fimbriimonadaceae bacterium]|nr:hypothetical protein [Fimbriimonadaceae bacterium]
GVTLSVPEVARHAEALLRASGERRPVGTPYRQLNPKGEVMFWYPLLVNGYRFFGGACSDQFWFMGHSGKFIEYHAAADPPPVNASTPKIDQKTALARVKTLMEEQRRDAARKGFGEVVYSGNPSFDLGYYVPEKETQGRLTWRVTVQSELRSQFASRPWNGIFLIDAVTGDQIHFTVVPTP